jgi:hypothetical protein
MTGRQVTEQDFRMPEFKEAKVEDYEFREDGKLVRKDRWERAIGSIRFLVGIEGREFEISEVVDAVRTLAEDHQNWVPVGHEDDYPLHGSRVNVRLTDGSLLKGAAFNKKEKCWTWQGLPFTDLVAEWQERPETQENPE